MTRVAAGIVFLLALLLAVGPLATQYDFAAQDRGQILSAPSAAHWLGTDSLGRDNLARFLYGGRLSVTFAASSALAACGIAALAGSLGALGGPASQLASSAVFDVLLSTPWYLLVFVIRALLPLDASPVLTAGITFAILGLVGWAHGARTVRDAVAEMTSRTWLRQARASGASGFVLWRGHIVPNLRPLLTTQFLLLLPSLMLTEATLGMLGLGIPEPLPSWGGSLVELVQASTVADRPWALVPALLLAVTAISLRTLAEGDAR